MSKKNKLIRAKLIANTGAGNVLEAATRLAQVTSYLSDYGLKVDVALALLRKKRFRLLERP